MVSRSLCRGDVYWVKTRPALVVSPDDMNAVLPRVIIAPITSAGRVLTQYTSPRHKDRLTIPTHYHQRLAHHSIPEPAPSPGPMQCLMMLPREQTNRPAVCV